MSLRDDIKNDASRPKRASSGDVSVDQRSLRDQIAADRYLRETDAGNKSKLPIRFMRIRPKGVSE